MTVADRKEEDSGMGRNWLAEQIAETYRHQIQGILDECALKEPAAIEHITFRRNYIELLIHFPFSLPVPTGDLGDRFPDKQAVDKFRHGLRAYLLEQHAGARLSNLFHGEVARFLLRFLRVYRFADDVRIGSKKKARQGLEEKVIYYLQNIGARRLAGRSKSRISKPHQMQIERDGMEVYRSLLEIQQKIREWKKKTKSIKENIIVARLREEYDRERYPWIGLFFRRIHVLPPTSLYLSYPSGTQINKKGNPPPPKLSDPVNWSATELTVMIIQEVIYRKTGVRYSRDEIRPLVKPGKAQS